MLTSRLRFRLLLLDLFQEERPDDSSDRSCCFCPKVEEDIDDIWCIGAPDGSREKGEGGRVFERRPIEERETSGGESEEEFVGFRS